MNKFKNFLIISKADDIYTIHLSSELQDDLGTIGFIKFNEKQNFEENEEILKVEASKTVYSIKSPIKGEVVEFNLDAIENPSFLNSSDFSQNWIVKLKNINQKEFDELETY